jgi:predicted ribonuclease YlaK
MKTFFLGTNVLLQDPDIIFPFQDNKVVILVVLPLELL